MVVKGFFETIGSLGPQVVKGPVIPPAFLNPQFEVSAVVIRKDGTREDLGVIARSKGKKSKRFVRLLYERLFGGGRG